MLGVTLRITMTLSGFWGISLDDILRSAIVEVVVVVRASRAKVVIFTCSHHHTLKVSRQQWLIRSRIRQYGVIFRYSLADSALDPESEPASTVVNPTQPGGSGFRKISLLD